mmetsp:Transcript_32471/g.56805  ORF Transcript_32471/g.56805 Transcript_32471/m.56805 type:complete len:81 (-) Transcript_32471:172-414(-)
MPTHRFLKMFKIALTLSRRLIIMVHAVCYGVRPTLHQAPNRRCRVGGRWANISPRSQNHPRHTSDASLWRRIYPHPPFAA